MEASHPLDGILVVEITTTIAGPYATKILQDLGARVLKIESRKGGDPFRNIGGPRLGDAPTAFRWLNGGKASITADFSDGDDVAAVRRLALEDADVVLQNMRPGAADRLGLGAEGLRAANPRLVYCNLGAYGGRGPLAHLPGYDPLMQAFGGIVATTGSEAAPARVGVSLIDMGTAMWAVIGITSALRRRELDGVGAVVDAALFETTLALMGIPIANYEAGGVVPKRTGLKGPIVVPNRDFPTADGLLVIAVVSDPQFARLARAIGRPELADDARFATAPARLENEDALIEAMNAALRTRGRAEWTQALDAADVPNSPVHGLAEVVAHPQTEASELLRPSGEGSARLVGLPLRLDGTRPSGDGPVPALGADDSLLEPYRGG